MEPYLLRSDVLLAQLELIFGPGIIAEARVELLASPDTTHLHLKKYEDSLRSEKDPDHYVHVPQTKLVLTLCNGRMVQFDVSECGGISRLDTADNSRASV
jgi:hypothetical protein